MAHGLQTPGEEITFTAPLKINSHCQIFRYGQSIFCLPHQPKFSDFFDLCLHWLSVVRGNIHMYCQNDYPSFFFQTKIRLEYNIGWLYLFNGCFFFFSTTRLNQKGIHESNETKERLPVLFQLVGHNSHSVPRMSAGMAWLCSHSILCYS